MKTRRNRYKEHPYLLYFAKFLADIIIAICLGIAFVQFILGKMSISGNSMDPILANDDVVFVNHFAYSFASPKRFDIVAFNVGGTDSTKMYVKRIIGLPGETIKIENGMIYINGQKLANDVSDELIITAGLASKEIVLGNDEYFVLGDNRNNSEDSRFANIGNVKKGNIVGKPWLIISPFSRFGFV